MLRIALRQLGQYDAAFEAAVEPDGRWRLDGGSYVTRGAREGRLGRRARACLDALAAAVGLKAVHKVPNSDFVSTLTIGDRTVRWWGPPPTPALQGLTGALARLGA